jgi:hypothetical protein
VIEGGDDLVIIGLVTHAEASQASPIVYGHRTFGTRSGFRERPRRPIVDTIAAFAAQRILAPAASITTLQELSRRGWLAGWQLRSRGYVYFEGLGVAVAWPPTPSGGGGTG